MANYTWSTLSAYPAVHLADPDQAEQPLCGANLTRRKIVEAELPHWASVVCPRCEARQRAAAKRQYDALAVRYRQALAKLMRGWDRSAYELASVTSMTRSNESLAWRIHDLPEPYEGGPIIEAMRELHEVWNRELPIEDLTNRVVELETFDDGATKTQEN